MDEEQLQPIPEEEPPKKGNEPIRYMIRILIGGYLCYLAYDLASGLWKGVESTMSPLVTYLISGGFALAGLALVVWNIRSLLKSI